MSRVGLIVFGLLIAFTLEQFFDVPRRWAVIVGLLPFGLAEASGLAGPYEQSARDIMHDRPESDDRA